MFAYTMAWTTAYPTLTEVFPTHLRSSGIGIAVAAGRVAGAVAPLLMIAIFEETGPLDLITGKHSNVAGAIGLLTSFFGLALIASIPWYFFGVEGRNVTLEGMVAKTNKQIIVEETGEKGENIHICMRTKNDLIFTSFNFDNIFFLILKGQYLDYS
ncbi:hypothetical protein K7432_005383 [Basidiobolus ranarum]|uniref:Major facilitator superfamily (MFS) profile domain-containing protein n=1 Tax=Basidiobolus ranarum TaxID=34480 RepID=A0ABR2WWK1_9FUNG